MHPGNDHDPYIDAATLAGHLSVTRETVLRWARTGDIPHLRAGRTYRFRESEVIAALYNPARPRFFQSNISSSRRRRL